MSASPGPDQTPDPEPDLGINQDVYPAGHPDDTVIASIDMEDGEPTKIPAKRETFAIPRSLRNEVDERDGMHCRVCGKHLGAARALHHIRFGGDRTGMGGRREHDLSNLITVCWMWSGNCHDLVHSQKRLWLPILERLTVTPGVTGFQLHRWETRRNR